MTETVADIFQYFSTFFNMRQHFSTYANICQHFHILGKLCFFFLSSELWPWCCLFLPFQSCVITTPRTGGQASDQCRIYRSFSCQSWPEVGRLLILCHAAPHSGDASQQSGCSIMSSLPSIPGLLWGNFLCQHF